MPFAARFKDDHTCPAANPNGNPHKGGPITAPCVVTVVIGGQPAATAGSMCTCAGPPDKIMKGSLTVLIGGQPAARVGDQTLHGGAIIAGCETVIIGD